MVSSYISDRRLENPHGHDWEEHAERCLLWQYGAKRTNDILRGRDDRANADLIAWERLGQRRAA